MQLVANLEGMFGPEGRECGVGRDSRGASAARRLAAEIVPKWSGACAANTMEYETALRAIMVEGHGPVEGLLAAVYLGDVDESKAGFLQYKLLRLGGGSDEEGPHEPDGEDNWGADPVKAFEASRRREVNASEPTVLEMRAAPTEARARVSTPTKDQGVFPTESGNGPPTAGSQPASRWVASSRRPRRLAALRISYA